MHIVNVIVISVLACLQVAVANKVDVARQRISAVKQLNSYIRTKNFDLLLSRLSLLSKSAIPMVNAVFAVVKDKNADSNQVKEMKTSFNLLNNDMQIPPNEFDGVKRSIQWSTVQVNYGTYERAIKAAMLNLKQVIEAPYEAQDSALKYFITKYENDFGNAGAKIYDGIINEGVFVNNLIRAARHFTKEHRRRVRVFGMGVMQLLFQAVEVEMAYSEMKYENAAHTEFVQNTWERRLEVIKKKLHTEDSAITNVFNRQQEIDRNELLAGNRHLSNKDFVQRFYHFMADKYDWRQWFAVAYRAVSGWDNHAITHCGGGVRFRYHGRNLAYSSSPYNGFNQGSAQTVMNSINVRGREARDVMNALNERAGRYCSPYSLRAAICWGCDVWYISHSNRRVYKKVCAHGRCYNAFLFG